MNKICPTCQTEYPEDVEFCPTDGTKLRTPRQQGTDPLLGRALDDRWIIEEKLGEGGMGSVYKGHQRSVNRTVAIKTLRPQLVDSDEFVDRFFREAQIAGNISHPHCVTILDYGESADGTLFLAMEFLDGESLTELLESGSLGIRQVIEIGTQVASALSAAHEQNIVHRDLKPDNIFLIDVPGGATFAKVLDFGIAKMLDSNTQMTKTGMIFGTPEYMSPEQCRGGDIDGRSDLYSLGCILYELVGGRTPFGGTTPMAVLMAHVNQSAPSLSEGETGAHVPAALEQIIMRLLEKDPERRFQTASEVREALESVLHQLDSSDGTAPSPAVAPSTAQEPREMVADPVEMGFDDTVGLDTGERPEASQIETVDAAWSDEELDTPNKRTRVAVAAVAGALLILAGSAFAVWFVTSQNGADETETASSVASQEPPSEPSAPSAPSETDGVAQTEPSVEAVEENSPAEESADESDAEPTVAAKTKPSSADSSDKAPAKPKPEANSKPERNTSAKAPPAQPEKTEQPKKAEKPKKKQRKKRRRKPRDVVEDVNTKAKKAKGEVEEKLSGADEELENALDGLLNE